MGKAVINFDKDQKEAYLADWNVAVSAGAGSGKTTVLSERYVRLINPGERNLNTNEVLTLTFTRKAAAEMYARIFKRLSAHPQAKERLAQFDQARISTLDSFCTAISRGVSYCYGISGDFKIDDKKLRRIAEETAAQVIMQHRHEDFLHRLVAARSFEVLVRDLFADIALSVFSFVRPGMYAVQAQDQITCITQETEKCCAEINQLFQTILALDNANRSETLKKAQEAVTKYAPLKALVEDAALETLIQAANFFASADSFSLPRSDTKDPVLIELREAAIPLKKEKALQLLVLVKTLCFREDILAIGRLLDEYEQLFLEHKRAQGLLSFQDTTQLAVDMLTKDIALRSYYKQHIKAIMIDEFQDNNALQKQLLYLLAEQDDRGISGVLPQAHDLAQAKLFFVGDEKQSIYRFRGADVSVFRGLSQELALTHDHASTLSLSTNYRSTPELVEFFNTLFPGVFGKASALFEAEFSPMYAGSGKEKKGDPFPVEVYVQEKSSTHSSGADEEEEDETSGETGEALSTAERIIAGVENGEFAFGDVAVLFRTTTHQNEYERTFRQTGIPFSAADPRGLFLEGPANDFYAILRLSLFPGDRNAYATVLRSPFVALGDESVFKILLEKPEEPFPEHVPESWFENPAEKDRYYHGRTVFSKLGNLIDIQGIAPVFAYLWYETGYRTYLLYDERSRPNVEHFEYLYSLALEADQRCLSLGAFLDELGPRMGTTDKTETEDIPELKNQVLFITVHKSKGLEFPVVILANAGSGGRGVQNSKPYFLDPQYGPTISLKSDTLKRNEKAVNYFYELRAPLAKQQAEAELKRLFYVAATRAKERLFVFGTRTVTKADEAKLANMDVQERLETLMHTVHTNSNGEIQRKSFLDLFSCGIAGASGNVPHYRLIPFSIPSTDEYKTRIRSLRERTAHLVAASQNQALSHEIPRPAHFYDKPTPHHPRVKSTTVNPSQMEAVSVQSRKPVRPVKRLSDFRSDRYLESQDCGPDQNLEDASVKTFSEDDRKKAFGTLCHRVIAQVLLKQDAGIFGSFADAQVKEAALKEVHRVFRKADLSQEAAHSFADEALDLAKRFLESPLGQDVAASARKQVEFPFILPVKRAGQDKPLLIHGFIDLIYEYKGQCVILDFKTDRYLHPHAHQVQVACYRAAAKAFSNLPLRSMLVYLRTMEAVPFDPDIPLDTLVELAQSCS